MIIEKREVTVASNTIYYRQLSAGWIPHLLTEEQREKLSISASSCSRSLTAELQSKFGTSSLEKKQACMKTTPKPSVSPLSGSFQEKMIRANASAVGASDNKCLQILRSCRTCRDCVVGDPTISCIVCIPQVLESWRKRCQLQSS